MAVRHRSRQGRSRRSGLLERRLEQWFRLDTGRLEYTVPAPTAETAAESPPEDVERLFSATETSRPEVWELLNREIDRAVSDRRTSYDGYNPYTYDNDSSL